MMTKVGRRKRRTSTPARRTRSVFLRAGFVLLLPALALFAFRRVSGRKTDVEEYVRSKAAGKSIKSRFTAVQIYVRYMYDSGWYYQGVGSLIRRPGDAEILTAEHLCQADRGRAEFAFRILHPPEKDASHAISSIIHAGAELANAPGSTPDVMVMREGLTSPWLSCISDRPIHMDISGVFEIVSGGDTLTSLVGGERVPVIGFVRNISGDRGAVYTIVDYPGIQGESGTGFVDARDRIYVLTDILQKIPPQLEKNIRRHGMLSLLFGPINPR